MMVLNMLLTDAIYCNEIPQGYHKIQPSISIVLITTRRNSCVCVPLTQQNDEKHMPTYTQGTKTPEMSPPSKARTEPCNLGKLLRFQPDFAYLWSTSELISRDNFGKPLPKVADSKSAPYITYMRMDFFYKLEDIKGLFCMHIQNN
jgi:hypothetical protein